MQYYFLSPHANLRPRIRRISAVCPTLFTLAILLFSAPPHLLARQTSAPPVAGESHERRHEERHEIELVIEQWRKAILHTDAPALDALLDDDFMAITAAGTLRTKEQTLEGLRSGKIHLTSMDIFDKRIRFYGKTALVNGRVVAAGSSPEGDLAGNYRYSQVFVRNVKGNWKIVSFEINRIRDPKERHEHEIEPAGR